MSSSQLFSSNSITDNTALAINTTSLLAGKVTISTASGGDQSSTTFTVVGTDMSGNAQIEEITGAAGGLNLQEKKYLEKLHLLLQDLQ